MILYVSRHARTEGNAGGALLGRSDEPLTAQGIVEAERLGRWLADRGIDRIFSSPQRRAYETAKIVAQSLPGRIEVRTDERLREMDFGIFEGLNLEEIAKQFPELHQQRRLDKLNFTIPEGESYQLVYDRMVSFLREQSGKSATLVITHGTALKLLLLAVTSMSLAEIESFRYGNTALFAFDLPGDEKNLKGKVLLFNSLAHLDESNG
ncbi:MAG: histidine phosphatase family protein [Deltaproteobacteria bacterium]|nr:histidine phosphatase family protein [Deltaproteobacteria bacterium]